MIQLCSDNLGGSIMLDIHWIHWRTFWWVLWL